MWSSWTEKAKASFQEAIEKTGDVLDKTGDVLTNSVTNASRKAREAKKQAPPQEDETTQASTAAAGRYSGSAGGGKESADPSSSSLLHTFQSGWSTVVESTKASLHRAQEVMEEQQLALQKKLEEQSRPRPRDLNLPLDVAALQDACVVYLTDRILTLSHPAMASSADGDITGERKLAAVGHLLHKRHDGRFMVWNLSEVDYDATLLDDQVLNYSFPGSPSPPLGLLLKLLVSMESWLKADSRNVAVVHCLTGRGRTSTVMASFLCWMKEASFVDIEETLSYIAQCKQVPVQELTIPSQRRYTSYFKNMLDGIRPSQPPLLLKRVILSHAPKYARGLGKPEWDEAQKWGCAPYLQLFKAGKLVFTAPATKQFVEQVEKTEDTKVEAETKTDDKTQGGEKAGQASATKKKAEAGQELPFCHIGDGSVSFYVNQIVQGDVLMRCRHLTAKMARVSMFRAAFHTGYIGGNVLRLTKAQLDGACADHDRFNDDFYMDIIFETIDAEEAGKLLQQQHDNAAAEAMAAKEEAAIRQPMTPEATALAGGAATVTASAYDTMLDRDSRFWDVIAKRKQEQESSLNKKKEGEVDVAAAAVDGVNPHPAKDDPFWGPTVGRRRPLEKEQALRDEQKRASGGVATKPASPKADTTFSIGGELDFLPKEPEVPPPKKKTPIRKVRDSLMEALMGALNDDDNNDDEQAGINANEVVIFEHSTTQTDNNSKDEQNKTKTTPAPKTETKPSDELPATTGTIAVLPTEESLAATPSTKTESTDGGEISKAEVDQLLSNVENMELDDDVNALLARGDVGDEDNGDDDDDDADLQDLETLLGNKKT